MSLVQTDRPVPMRVAGWAWVWVPPLVMLGLAAFLAMGDGNGVWFRRVNGLSRFTGPNYWILLTILSDGVVSAAIMAPWIRRRPRHVFALLVAGLALSAVGVLLKEARDLPRPSRVLPPEAITVIGPNYRDHSFPSGHAGMALAMASVWGLAERRILPRCVFLFFGALVAMSRIVVGVHWPVDVLVGGAVGWLAGPVGLRAADRWRWGHSPLALKVMGGAMLVCVVIIFFPYCGFREVIWEQRTLALILLLVAGREYGRLYQKPAALPA